MYLILNNWRGLQYLPCQLQKPVLRGARAFVASSKINCPCSCNLRLPSTVQVVLPSGLKPLLASLRPEANFKTPALPSAIAGPPRWVGNLPAEAHWGVVFPDDCRNFVRSKMFVSVKAVIATHNAQVPRCHRRARIVNITCKSAKSLARQPTTPPMSTAAQVMLGCWKYQQHWSLYAR